MLLRFENHYANAESCKQLCEFQADGTANDDYH